MNGTLRAIAGMMQQVVANNETKYQAVIGVLQQAFHRLQEPQEASTAAGDGSKARSSRRSPLELKVRGLTEMFYDSYTWQREVRRYSLELLGRKNKKSPVPPPPDPDVIQRFNETGKGGPRGEPGKLRLDLLGPIRSPWNKRAARCFRQHFRRGGLHAKWSKRDIEAAFLQHTNTIRSHYRRQKGEITQQDLDERNDKASKKNRVDTVRSSGSLLADPLTYFKPQLTQHRRAVCESHKDMEDFKKYIDILDLGGGMSEDEPDWRSTTGGAKTPKDYFVVRPAWRSQEVTAWLRVMDNVYLARRFTSDGRVTRGSWIRNRKPSNRVNHEATPIKGLPLNFYDEGWLASLPPKQRRRLRAKKPLDLAHTEKMMGYALHYSSLTANLIRRVRIATRYAQVKKRSDKPLGIQ